MRLPPLRERRDDILPLAQHFLRKHAGRDSVLRRSRLASAPAVTYDWPGNMR